MNEQFLSEQTEQTKTHSKPAIKCATDVIQSVSGDTYEGMSTIRLAVNVLCETLQSLPPQQREEMAHLLPEFIKSLRGKTEDAKTIVAKLLDLMPHDPAIITKIIELAGDEHKDVRRTAIHTINKILIENYTDSEKSTSSISDETMHALAALLPNLLQSKDENTIEDAISSMKLIKNQVNVDVKHCIPKLISLLHHKNLGIKLMAIQMLGDFGEDADEAYNRLCLLLASPYNDIVEAARKAIDKIRGTNSSGQFV